MLHRARTEARVARLRDLIEDFKQRGQLGWTARRTPNQPHSGWPDSDDQILWQFGRLTRVTLLREVDLICSLAVLFRLLGSEESDRRPSSIRLFLVVK